MAKTNHSDRGLPDYTRNEERFRSTSQSLAIDDVKSRER